MRMLLWSLAIASLMVYASAGGGDCAACALVVGLIERVAMNDRITIGAAVRNLCKNFKDNTIVFLCDSALQQRLTPAIEKDFLAGFSPDYTCTKGGAASLKMCENYPQCQMYPVWPPKSFEAKDYVQLDGVASPFASTPSSTVPLGLQAELMLRALNLVPPTTTEAAPTLHLPFFDLDKDAHSTSAELRGFHWRGKDCNDLDANVYPGRARSGFGPAVDHNCNGIAGTDPRTGESYESKFCSGSQAKGVVILGDSAAAHFRIPPRYFDPVGQNSSHNFDDLPALLLNEADWPMCSWATGFLDSNSGCDKSLLPFKSFYQRMRERNRCNHRDYANIGVNGGSTRNMAPPDGIIASLARGKNDNPAVVVFAVIGNDVCNGHAGFDRMTTPEAFERDVLASLEYLEGRLAPGSSVIFIPLVDGRVLYDALHDKVHPTGITYSHFYDYLNCLESSPCWGWMNTNATVRNLTSARAALLSSVYSKIVREQSSHFKSFSMFYNDFDWKATFNRWTASGRSTADLIEPTDGFHPSTTAGQLIAETVWNITLATHPEILGPVNPFNAEIDRLFGDQGGHV